MAQSVHVYLKANDVDLLGESSIVSMGREGSIEALEFTDSVRTAREKSSGMATGQRTYDPLTFVKRIDKSSPLLAKALCLNETIEGTFKFFRPSPSGDGTTQQFFTIAISEGRIAGIKRHSPNVIDPALANEPPTELVSIVFHTIIWTYEDGGVSHEDNWKQQA
jgi:type VI secretion system secreted protein Hcp